MKKLLCSAFLFLSLILGGGMALPAQAQVTNNAFGKYFNNTFKGTFDTDSSGGNLEQTLPQAVGSIISAFLAFIGVILLVVLVYAGFLWITAGGNEDQVKKAKRFIINGVIGLVIALSAFIITSFVVQQVTSALQTSTPTSTGGAGS